MARHHHHRVVGRANEHADHPAEQHAAHEAVAARPDHEQVGATGQVGQSAPDRALDDVGQRVDLHRRVGDPALHGRLRRRALLRGSRRRRRTAARRRVRPARWAATAAARSASGERVVGDRHQR